MLPSSEDETHSDAKINSSSVVHVKGNTQWETLELYLVSSFCTADLWLVSSNLPIYSLSSVCYTINLVKLICSHGWIISPKFSRVYFSSCFSYGGVVAYNWWLKLAAYHFQSLQYINPKAGEDMVMAVEFHRCLYHVRLLERKRGTFWKKLLMNSHVVTY